MCMQPSHNELMELIKTLGLPVVQTSITLSLSSTHTLMDG